MVEKFPTFKLNSSKHKYQHFPENSLLIAITFLFYIDHIPHPRAQRVEIWSHNAKYPVNIPKIHQVKKKKKKKNISFKKKHPNKNLKKFPL